MNTWNIQGRLVGYDRWLCRLRPVALSATIGGWGGYGCRGLRDCLLLIYSYIETNDWKLGK